MIEEILLRVLLMATNIHFMFIYFGNMIIMSHGLYASIIITALSHR